MGRRSGRDVAGFALSMIAGILVILNAAALLSNSFYNMWIGIFFWIPVIDPSAGHGLIFAIGAIIGLILVIGSILILLGYSAVGVVVPLAVLSLIIGGGFVAGFVLGVLGGLLGMLGRTPALKHDVASFRLPSEFMFCRECGKQIPRSSKFCPECGSDITSTSSDRTITFS